jgi:hypothetical protein
MNANKLRQRMFRIASIMVALLALGVLAFGAQIPEQALNTANPRVQEIMAVQEAVTPDLMSMAGGYCQVNESMAILSRDQGRSVTLHCTQVTSCQSEKALPRRNRS